MQGIVPCLAFHESAGGVMPARDHGLVSGHVAGQSCDMSQPKAGGFRELFCSQVLIKVPCIVCIVHGTESFMCCIGRLRLLFAKGHIDSCCVLGTRIPRRDVGSAQMIPLSWWLHATCRCLGCLVKVY